MIPNCHFGVAFWFDSVVRVGNNIVPPGPPSTPPHILSLHQIQLAASNLTTNESFNWKRYAYLKRKDSKTFHNPYDRGVWMNLKEYFRLQDSTSHRGEGMHHQPRDIYV